VIIETNTQLGKSIKYSDDIYHYCATGNSSIAVLAYVACLPTSQESLHSTYKRKVEPPSIVAISLEIGTAKFSFGTLTYEAGRPKIEQEKSITEWENIFENNASILHIFLLK
jgi:hypothetical protein